MKISTLATLIILTLLAIGVYVILTGDMTLSELFMKFFYVQ